LDKNWDDRILDGTRLCALAGSIDTDKIMMILTDSNL